jgi:hypothetical protein
MLWLERYGYCPQSKQAEVWIDGRRTRMEDERGREERGSFC